MAHLWPQVSLVDLINLFVQLMDVELNETVLLWEYNLEATKSWVYNIAQMLDAPSLVLSVGK